MSASLRFIFSLVLVGGIAACSDPVRPLNDPVPEGGDGGASAGSGGGAGTPNGGASFGGNPDGGAALGGTSMGGSSVAGGAGAGGSIGPECPLLTPTGCAANEVCIEDPNDGCNGFTRAICPGVCKATTRPSQCSGFTVLPPCPEDFSCVPDPGIEGQVEDAPGICVGPGPSPTCDATTNEGCRSGFRCLNGSCAPDGVSCAGQVFCRMATPQCPDGYTPSTLERCYGPCVPIHTCGCSTSSDCPTGSVCDRSSGRCEELAENPCPDGQVLHEFCRCGPADECVGHYNVCVDSCADGLGCDGDSECRGGLCIPNDRICG